MVTRPSGPQRNRNLTLCCYSKVNHKSEIQQYVTVLLSLINGSIRNLQNCVKILESKTMATRLSSIRKKVTSFLFVLAH